MRAAGWAILLVLASGAIAQAEPPAPPVPTALGAVSLVERPGAELPLDAEFVDARGQRRELGEVLRGDIPSLMTLSYSTCPMLCDLVLRGIVESLPQLGLVLGRDFRVVTILIDPRETQSSAAQIKSSLLAKAGRDERSDDWLVLTGREREIRAVASAVGFGYQRDPRSGQYAHPAAIFVLTSQGRVSSYLHGVRFAPSELRPALLAAAVGRTDGASSIGAAVLRCFRFDPALRKYGPQIDLAFRIGAALLLSGLVAMVSLLVRRERRRR